MKMADTYPVPIEQERLAMAMGFFNPVATPTDAQREEAARMVEGWVVFKRTAYWMHLQEIVERDQRKKQQKYLDWMDMYKHIQPRRKPSKGKKNRSRQHYTKPREIVLAVL